MPLHLTSQDIFWRLLSTVLGAILVGFDRGEHGHAVGMRTTLLVSLAACLAMLQANALLDMTGKAPESFAVMDLMRLPLGILSGIGFIGGGAILRRENLVTGVTTAATLWFMTVLGLCFGGGQIALGWIGIGLGLFILAVLRGLERRIPREAVGTLTVEIEQPGPTEEGLREQLLKAGMKIKSTKLTRRSHEQKIRVEWSIHRVISQNDSEVPSLVKSMSMQAGLSLVEWSPIA